MNYTYEDFKELFGKVVLFSLLWWVRSVIMILDTLN
jgi:hypothetical protein